MLVDGVLNIDLRSRLQLTGPSANFVFKGHYINVN